MTTAKTLAVSDAELYFEVRGSGPVLLALGAPMEAAVFAPIAELLSDRYRVVTHDPRGISNSRLNDPEQDSTPDLRADDVAAILDDLEADRADVLGSSGGAVTALALATRHPDRVGTVVAHEPPLLTLLPDAEDRLTSTRQNIEIFHRDGLGAAFGRFMADAGFDEDDAPPPQQEPSEQDIANGSRFFAHELLHTVRYESDIEALRKARIVVGIGEQSHGLTTFLTSTALADLLGVAPVGFPGGHTGFADRPEEFAPVLRQVLAAG